MSWAGRPPPQAGEPAMTRRRVRHDPSFPRPRSWVRFVARGPLTETNSSRPAPALGLRDERRRVHAKALAPHSAQSLLPVVERESHGSTKATVGADVDGLGDSRRDGEEAIRMGGAR